jgi:hypothetical protein
LDIILSSRAVQTKLNMDQGDDEMQQRIPITEVKEWNDTGFSELILPYTDPAYNDTADDGDLFGRLNTSANRNPSLANLR